MYIDSSVNFEITSASASAYGVYFGSTASSSTIINGTFTINSASTARGVFFNSTADGSITINGVFAIVSTGDEAFGVYFKSNTAGFLNINGTFSITSVNYEACGVRFFNITAGVVSINGTFSVVCYSYHRAIGVRFGNTASGSIQTINAIFTITCFDNNNAYGVFLSSTIGAGSLTINGTFTIFAGSDAYGVYFDGVATSSLNIMNTTQFFSNKADSGNIFAKISGWNQTYKWNNADVSAALPAGNNSTADPALKLKDVDDNATPPNFIIEVINECGTSNQLKDNKKTFNTAYKNALQAYVDGSNCPTTAKQWLKDIIGNIPIPPA